MRSGRARAVALVALIACGAAAAALSQRTALARWVALRALAARGLPADLRVARLGWHDAQLADVRVGAPDAPDLTLASAELAWSWAGLRDGRLDRVALRGLRLRGRIDAQGAHFGALDALRELGADETAPGALALPFLEASLDDARATIASPQGVFAARASGRARPDGDVLRAELTLHGDSPQGALDFGGGATIGLVAREVSATGALRGATPWGSAEGLARAEGSLDDTLRAQFTGSATPDARALGVGASEPIAFRLVAERRASGDVDGRIHVDAAGTNVPGLATVVRATGDATVALRGGALALAGSLTGEGAAWAGVAQAAGFAAEGTWRAAGGAPAPKGPRLAMRGTLRGVVAPELARADAVAFSLAQADDGTLQAEATAERALAPDLARLEGVRVAGSLAGNALRGELRVAKLVELSKPALVAPLRLEAALSGTPEQIAFTGSAHTPGDGLAFALSGTLAPGPGELALRIVLPESDFSPAVRQPARVFPWLADTITALRGKAGLEALATYAQGKLGASGVLALNGADLATPWATLRGLMGVVTVTAIDPLETPPGQTLWMKSAEAGLPLGAGSVRFRLRKDGVLDVENAEWGLAEGKLRFTGPIPLEAEERKLTLQVEDVSLEALLKALDFDGLSGTGRLAGSAPIVSRGEALLVQNGALHASQVGVIRFQPGAGGAALSEKQPVLVPLLGALENLAYEELTLVANGDLGGRVDVQLHIRGKNPNYQKGRPVVLNVNVDLPLGSLLRAAAAATGVPNEIEERVQRAMSEEKK